jgi:CHASE2 domain-containing sensor protein
MTPERMAQLQEIFEAAVNLSEPQRTAYLEQACAGDPAVRDRLEQLLAADDETVVLADPVSAAAPAGVQECPRCWRCYQGPLSTCPSDASTLQFAFVGSQLIDGKYLVERRLGRGGMGAVYLAQHVGLEKRFALKLILSEVAISPKHRENFKNEARALGHLNHHNIVSVTDYGIDPRGGGLPYLVMEYLEGKTLNQLLNERKILPFEETLHVLRVVASAIDAAHNADIVHGDLKPSNLFLAKVPDSALPCLKIVDFGLARLTNPLPSAELSGSPRKQPGSSIRGTPGYMAPELLRSEEATPASDQFALGAIAFEMLAGCLPFGQRLAEVSVNIKHSTPAPSSLNSALPPDVDGPVLSLLNPIPHERPRSASGAISAISRAWLSAQQRAWRAREWPKRLVLAAAVTGVVLSISAGLAQLHLARIIEGRIADQRFAVVREAAPDPGLMLVSIDDATVNADQRPLAEWADEFAAVIESMFASGAKAVAVDIMLPFHWSESQTFAKAITAHADRLTLAVYSAPSGEIVGSECVSRLTAYMLAPVRYANLFGLVNLEEDEDRTVRRARMFYVDRTGHRRGTFARRAVDAAFPERRSFDSPGETLWIDYAVRPSQLKSISWKDVSSRLQAMPDLFRGRLVLVGSTFAGNGDEHRVPAVASNAPLPGQFIQALIANTILSDNPIHEIGLWPCLAAIGFACLAATSAALCFPHRYGFSLTGSPVLLCAYAGFAFWIFRASRMMIAVVGPELAILISMLAAWGLKSRLSAYPAIER